MIVRTRPQWATVVQKVLASRDIHGVRAFAYDTETLDRGYPDIKTVGFSLAWFEPTPFGVEYGGAYIPIGHSTGELTLSPGDVLPDLKMLLEDEDVEVAMHNGKYDIKVSSLNGIKVTEKVFDTLVMSWLLNTNGVGSKLQVLMGEGEHGLKALTLHLFGHKMTELADLAPKEKYMKDGVEFEVLRVDLVPVDALGPYAWEDSVYTLKLRDHFRPQLEAEPKTKKVYESIQREFIHVLADMEMFGHELDTAFLRAMRSKVDKELVGIKQRMYELRPGEDFPAVADVALVKKLADQYQDYEDRFKLPKDHPEYPKQSKTKTTGRGANKVTVNEISPANKGGLRKALFEAFGMLGHPLADKIRDDKLRPEIQLYPHLAHKIFNPASVQVLNAVLFDEGDYVPMGERGDNGMYSTKAEYVDIWAGSGGIAKELQRLREIDKLRGTYLVGMVAQASADLRIRGRMNQGGTRTGRLSMSDPNLQNQPNNPEFPIREAFVATGILACTVTILEWNLDDKGKQTKPKHLIVQSLPPDDPKHVEYTKATGRVIDGGYEIVDGWVVRWWGQNPPFVLFVGDYSQLEICLLAHESNDPRLVKAVTEGQDIHALTAQGVFDEIPKDMSLEDVKKNFKKLRSDAKPINFGILYGMGPQKLAATLGISVEAAKDIIENRYMGFYKGVAAWIQRQHNFVRENGFVVTAFGRRRHLPAAQLDPNGMTSGVKNRELISKAKRQAQNTPIQGDAADLVALAQRDIRRQFTVVTLMDLADDGFLGGENGESPTHDGPLWGGMMRMLLQVHDELIQESHPAVANYMRRESVARMEAAGGVKLRVPIRVDAKLGTNWWMTKE